MPAYSQNPEFLRVAFSHYLDGRGATQICDLMRPEYPDVAVRTLQRVAKDNGWEKARARYLKIACSTEEYSKALLPNVILDLERVKKALDSKGYRGLMFQEIAQYRGLCDDLLWLAGKHPKQKNDSPLVLTNDREQQAFLEVLSKHKVIGPLLRKHRGEIIAAVEERIEAGSKKAEGRRKK